MDERARFLSIVQSVFENNKPARDYFRKIVFVGGSRDACSSR